jgi:hypothetical protein
VKAILEAVILKSNANARDIIRKLPRNTDVNFMEAQARDPDLLKAELRHYKIYGNTRTQAIKNYTNG